MPQVQLETHSRAKSLRPYLPVWHRGDTLGAMRFCPRCGRPKPQEGGACVYCRDSGAIAGSSAPPAYGNSERPSNDVVGTAPEASPSGRAPGPGEIRRTKTLLGHSAEPPPAPQPLEYDQSSLPTGPNQSITPAPVITVLGVPIPRPVSSRPRNGWQPADGSSAALRGPSVAPPREAPTQERDLGKTQQLGTEIPRVSNNAIVPVRANPGPDLLSGQTLMGSHNLDIRAGADPNAGAARQRLRPGDPFQARQNAWQDSDQGPQTVPLRTAAAGMHTPVPPRVSDSPADPRGRSFTPPGPVSERGLEIDSLFYCIDSQVLGLPVPSRPGTPSSTPPAPASRRASTKMAKVRQRSRRIVWGASVVIVCAIAVIVYVATTGKKGHAPAPRAVRSLPAATH